MNTSWFFNCLTDQHSETTALGDQMLSVFNNSIQCLCFNTQNTQICLKMANYIILFAENANILV